jgi:hypothetical protein
MSKLIQLTLLLSLIPGAFAHAAKSPDCSSVLKTQPRVIDYAASDLEGTFLALVEKVQSAAEVPAARREYFIRDVLNMKAALLNQIGDLLPFLLREKPEMIPTVYAMLDSIGVPPKIYGLEVDEKNRLVIPSLPPQGPRAGNDNEIQNAPIGFLKPSALPARDLEAGLHRSIGFADFSVRGEAAPLRRTGQIQRGIAKQNKSILIVADGETGKSYAADLRILTSAGAEIEGKKLALQFNPDIREWIVLVENLNNPTGKIGF